MRSILDQTLNDLEVLVVDDGSTDDTGAVAEQMAGRDPRVRVFRHVPNLGPSAARNTALDAARGTWIAIVDSDDWIAPGRLEQLVNGAEANDADWIADDLWLIPPDVSEPALRVLRDEPAGVTPLPVARLIRNDGPEEHGYGLLQPLIRRSFVEQNRIRYRIGYERVEDFLFTVDCAAAGARMFVLNEPLYIYCQRRAGAMTERSPLMTLTRMLQANELAGKLLARLGDPDIDRAIDERAAAALRCLNYRRVVEPVRERAYMRALREYIAHPGVTLYLLRRIMQATMGRLRPRRRYPRDMLQSAFVP